MRTYPASFPCPMVAGYQYTVAAGVIRSDGSNRYEQRRVHKIMPHIITASFTLTPEEWGIWQVWMTEHGYEWFEFDELPTMYQSKKALVVRLVADSIKISARSQKIFKADAKFEVSPTMYLTSLEA